MKKEALVVLLLLLLAGTIIFGICNKNNNDIHKTIDLYEHVDPVTGVHYYIYEGNMYPRVCADGTYYSTYIKDDEMVPAENVTFAK